MPEINEEMAKVAYKIGMDIFDNKKSFMEGVRILRDDYKMNSASIYINNLSKFRKGEVYKRIISKRDTIYFLSKIKQDYGNNGLLKALNAVKKHIEYLEIQGTGNKKALKQIYKEFMEEIK